MLQTSFYDTTRFKSDEEAINSKELYTAKYLKDKCVLIDPDGVETEIQLNYVPIAGLDVSDAQKVLTFLNNDMDKRASL